MLLFVSSYSPELKTCECRIPIMVVHREDTSYKSLQTVTDGAGCSPGRYRCAARHAPAFASGGAPAMCPGDRPRAPAGPDETARAGNTPTRRRARVGSFVFAGGGVKEGVGAARASTHAPRPARPAAPLPLAPPRRREFDRRRAAFSGVGYRRAHGAASTLVSRGACARRRNRSPHIRVRGRARARTMGKPRGSPQVRRRARARARARRARRKPASPAASPAVVVVARALARRPRRSRSSSSRSSRTSPPTSSCGRTTASRSS